VIKDRRVELRQKFETSDGDPIFRRSFVLKCLKNCFPTGLCESNRSLPFSSSSTSYAAGATLYTCLKTRA